MCVGAPASPRRRPSRQRPPPAPFAGDDPTVEHQHQIPAATALRPPWRATCNNDHATVNAAARQRHARKRRPPAVHECRRYRLRGDDACVHARRPRGHRRPRSYRRRIAAANRCARRRPRARWARATARRRRPNIAASRASMLARPKPAPALSARPRPVSSTRTRSTPSVASATMRTEPPRSSGASPCLIAFSTSVESIIGGRCAACRCAGHLVSNRSRSPILIFCTLR